MRYLHRGRQDQQVLDGFDEHARLGLCQPHRTDGLLLAAVLDVTPIPAGWSPNAIQIEIFLWW